MLNTNLFSCLGKSLHHNVSYSKGCKLCKGKCIVYCESPNKSMYLLIKVCHFWRPFRHIFQLYSQIALVLYVDISLHLSLHQVAKWKEWGKTKGFSDRFLDVPLIYVTSLLCNNCLTFLYLPRFVIKMPHFVVDAPFCSSVFLLCSKLHTPLSPIL